MKRQLAARRCALLLCAIVLLSGALLILHAGCECSPSTCPVCTMLAQNAENFLYLPMVFVGVGALGIWSETRPSRSAENRFAPDATPVRRKVKLLN